MAKIEWDKIGTRLYETGMRNCVIFVQDEDGIYQNGAAWNGIVSVTESATGGDAIDFYADDIKYLTLYPPEDLGASIEAYTYPDEFLPCDGVAVPARGLMIFQQPRRTFALCYKSIVGNDILGTDYGYKLHVLYGCTVSPSEKAYQTINDDPEPLLFSWDLTTLPVSMPDYKNTSSVVLDSTKVSYVDLEIIENRLYGTNESDSELLFPSQILEILTNGLLTDDAEDYIVIGEDRIRV